MNIVLIIGELSEENSERKSGYILKVDHSDWLEKMAQIIDSSLLSQSLPSRHAKHHSLSLRSVLVWAKKSQRKYDGISSLVSEKTLLFPRLSLVPLTGERKRDAK